jgi:hypothetical protein
VITRRDHAVHATWLVMPPSAHRYMAGRCGPPRRNASALPSAQSASDRVRLCVVGGEGSDLELGLAVRPDRRLRGGIGGLPFGASRCPMSAPLEVRVKLLNPVENVIGRLLTLVACRL